MDGTAALTFPFSTYEAEGREQTGLAEDKNVYEQEGGIIKSDPSKKNISLVFTADEWADGADDIIATLKKNDIKGRIETIRRQIEETTSDYDREKLQERLAKLVGGVAGQRVEALARA